MPLLCSHTIPIASHGKSVWPVESVLRPPLQRQGPCPAFEKPGPGRPPFWGRQLSQFWCPKIFETKTRVLSGWRMGKPWKTSQIAIWMEKMKPERPSYYPQIKTIIVPERHGSLGHTQIVSAFLVVPTCADCGVGWQPLESGDEKWTSQTGGRCHQGWVKTCVTWRCSYLPWYHNLLFWTIYIYNVISIWQISEICITMLHHGCCEDSGGKPVFLSHLRIRNSPTIFSEVMDFPSCLATSSFFQQTPSILWSSKDFSTHHFSIGSRNLGSDVASGTWIARYSQRCDGYLLVICYIAIENGDL